jgi:hypothetical protein
MIIKKLESEIELKGEWNTSSAPGFFVVRPKGEDKGKAEVVQVYDRNTFVLS